MLGNPAQVLWAWSELAKILVLGNFLTVVKLICRPTRTDNQLYKNPKIALLKISYYLCTWPSSQKIFNIELLFSRDFGEEVEIQTGRRIHHDIRQGFGQQPHDLQRGTAKRAAMRGAPWSTPVMARHHNDGVLPPWGDQGHKLKSFSKWKAVFFQVKSSHFHIQSPWKGLSIFEIWRHSALAAQQLSL